MKEIPVRSRFNASWRLAMWLALFVLTLLAAGCGGNTTNEGESQPKNEKNNASSSESNNKASNQSDSKEEAPSGTLNAGATLKIYVPSNVEDFPNGEDANNNLIANYLSETTGYDLQWEIQPRENADQKINIMMASGETPDLIVTSNKAIFTNLAQQGLLTSLDDIVKQFGPQITEAVPQEAWDAVTYEGKIYAIPVPQNQISTHGLLIRKDWLDQTGLSEPKTVDEYYEVLKAFKDLELGGSSTLPMTAGASEGNGNAFGYLQAFGGAYGLDSPYIVEGDKVIHTHTSEKAREFLTFMNKLYSEGLLDQEYPINKQANIQEKLVGGKAGMTTLNWVIAKSVIESFNERGEGEMVYIHPPVGPHGDWGFTKHQPVRSYLIIPRFSEHANEVVDFINRYMEQEVMDTVSYGWEGTHHEVVDGNIDNLPEMENIRFRIYYRLWDTVTDFNNRVRLSGFLPYYEPIAEHSRVTNILNFAPPLEAVEQNNQTLSDLTNEYFVKIITGSLPLEAFDDYVKQWENEGGLDSMEAINEWYADFK